MQRYKEFISLTNFSDGKCNLGALFNDFVPKLTVETHILREFRSYLMKNVYLSGVIVRVPLFASDESVKSVRRFVIYV